jgi:hypothetical protein
VQKTDYFGTFLDAMSSSSLAEKRTETVAPASQRRAEPSASPPHPRLPIGPAAAGAAAGALAGAAAGAIAWRRQPSTSRCSPGRVGEIDAVMKVLHAWEVQGSALETKYLIPYTNHSLSLLLTTEKQLEQFGFVRQLPDNYIQLTKSSSLSSSAGPYRAA